MRRATLIGACLLAMSGLVSASTTFALYGTGFTNTGTLVSAGGTDGNWTLESAPTVADGCGSSCVSGVTTPEAPFVTDTGQFPFTGSPAWLADSSTSEWISPFANESTNSDPDSATVAYVYQESFSLTGLVPSSAVITGQWSADNYGFIEVNGTKVTLGTSGNIPNNPQEFTSFTSFVLNSSNATFNAGANTIDFFVFNNANGTPDVTGVNIDIESDSATSATPEPASWALTGLGLAALALVGRRRLAS